MTLINKFFTIVSIALLLLPVALTCTSRFVYSDNMCTLTATSQLKCWGLNTNGHLGYEDTANRGGGTNDMGNYLPYVNVGSGVINVHAGDDHVCVHLQDWSVKCWGRNQQGQLGYGDTSHRGQAVNEMGNYLPTLSYGTGVVVQDLTAGEWQSGIITTQGDIKTW